MKVVLKVASLISLYSVCVSTGSLVSIRYNVPCSSAKSVRFGYDARDANRVGYTTGKVH